jgi:DNA-directed RNA polymerase beta subunit
MQLHLSERSILWSILCFLIGRLSPCSVLFLLLLAAKYVERVALPYVFKYLVTELAAMNIRCSLDVK